MISAPEALQRLRDGNRRFVSGGHGHGSDGGRSPAPELSSQQEPFAIVLGCSDSRVPAEIVFDQGLGDLFVIRVAGNIVAPSLVGSVEFAAKKLGTRLVVVLGHTGCGVISTALQEIERPIEDHSPNLQAIIDRVRPIVEESVRTGQGLPPADLARDAVRRNVEASAEYLRHDSEVLADLIERDGLMVVCAEYSLDTGEVAFFGDEEAR